MLSPRCLLIKLKLMIFNDYDLGIATDGCKSKDKVLQGGLL